MKIKKRVNKSMKSRSQEKETEPKKHISHRDL